MGKCKVRSAGIASLSSWNSETKEVVNSLLFKSLDTRCCDFI